MSLGDMIRKKRIERGMTQREFAKAVGVTPGAVSQWESDTSIPAVENMDAIKGLLGITVSTPLSPSEPYSGQLIEDREEIALIDFWRNLKPTEQRDALFYLMQRGRATKPRNGEAA